MNFEFIKTAILITVSVFVQQLSLSRSQANRIIKNSDKIRRSLNSRGSYLAHVVTVRAKAFQSGIAFINGCVFSTEYDIVSAMVKCVRESRWGRTRESFENMFRCKDMGKSFKQLEKREDVVVIKLGKKYLYLSKERKEEQISNYYHKKGRLLREKDKEVITTALVFSVLQYRNVVDVEAVIRKSRNRGGRRPFPTEAMINAIVYRVMHKLSSFDALTKELENNPDLAVALGFDLEQGTPSASCFSRFVQLVGRHIGKNVDKKLELLLKQKRELKRRGKKTAVKRDKSKRPKPNAKYFTPLTDIKAEIKSLNKKIGFLEKEVPKNGWYLLFADMVSQLLTLQIIDGKFVCLDATHLDASRKDPNMSYGVKRTRKLEDGSIVITKDFFGYKLHIAVDAKTNLPVAITITTGCVPDNKEAPKIIRQLKRHGIFFKALLADGGYNDRKIYSEVYKYNKTAKFICPLPKDEDGTESVKEHYYDPETRQKYTIHYNTENGRKLFRMRGPTENINKIIKCDLKMNKPRVRGIRAIESLAYIHCIAILAFAIAAKLTDREHLINQFSNLV